MDYRKTLMSFLYKQPKRKTKIIIAASKKYKKKHFSYIFIIFNKDKVTILRRESNSITFNT